MRIRLSNKKNKSFNHKTPYLLMNILGIAMIGLAFFIDSPIEILEGLRRIILRSGTLITDYIEVGGIGASLINAGILLLIFNIILLKNKIIYNGATYASLFLLTGFAFFGKNIINIWPIIGGVYLYARYQKQPFKKYIYIAIFGTAMSPIISEIVLFKEFNFIIRMFLGTGTGVLIGFILPNVASFLVTVHHGFNLYNVGFASGVIGTIFVSIYKSHGLEIKSSFFWSTGNNMQIAIVLYTFFIIILGLGYYYNDRSFREYINIYKYSGRLVSDFVSKEGHGLTFINMGINGVVSTSALLLLQGDLNGPTIAGIFTIVGFGAFGKHLNNIVPIWLGVILAVSTQIWPMDNPGIQLAFLFSTGLAPIAGEYGWRYGIIAGFMHTSLVMYIGVLHGGINLYNNGFAAGLIASFLIPFIDSFKKG